MTQEKIVFNLSVMETIHLRIARLRNAKELSMAGLAKRVGVAWQTIQQWEKGGTAPQRKRIPAVAEALGVTEAYLQFGEDQDPNNEDKRKALDDQSNNGDVYKTSALFNKRKNHRNKVIYEIIQLVNEMDDLGRGMALQAVRSISKERKDNSKANTVAS